MKSMTMPFPIVIAREGEWFVASCPLLSLATQGKTEEEVKEMMADLINEYLSDPDTAKPSVASLMSVSLTNIPINVPEGVLNRKTSTAFPA
ncbi:MAG: type II toxin-antitoxin system HicB family antitoxin [Candidatus Micrarchaeota archaeon]